VDRETLVQKLNTIFDEWQQCRAWGNVEIELRDGEPNMIRKTTNEKLQSSQENNRDRHRFQK
jgi:hypothetical protein